MIYLIARNMDNFKKDRQCIVKLKHVRATIVAVETCKYYIFRIVFVAIGMQHAMRMHHIVMCGLSDSTVVFHIAS
jgi:hypothetical protein